MQKVKAPKEPTAYDALRKALFAAHAMHLATTSINSHSALEVWVLVGGRMRIVNHFTDTGGWDAYKPIKASKTDEAIAEVLADDAPDPVVG